MKDRTMVKFNYDKFEKWDLVCDKYLQKYISIFKDDVWIFLGEIANMPKHGIYLNFKTSEIVSGYHIDNFIEYNE